MVYISRPVLLLALALAGALAPAASPASAQSVRGVEVLVIDSLRQQPLPGALVRAGSRAVRTDGRGVARMEGMFPAAVEVEVSHPGYLPAAGRLRPDASGGARARLALLPRPVDLSAVEVSAAARRSPLVNDFYRRVQRGTGRYITRADIERIRPRNLGDLFRTLPGLQVVGDEASGERPTFVGAAVPGIGPSGSRRECQIRYFLDGTPIQPPEGKIGHDVRLDEVEGVEFYRGSAGVPARFADGNQRCGTVLIWKRDRL